MMKTRNIVAAFSMAGLLASLSTSVTATVENPHIRPAGQEAAAQSNHDAVEKHYENETRKKHEVLARYYENEARKTQTKARELKLLLEQYEEKSYLYGKKAQDLRANTEALVRQYEQAAEADRKEAVSHRQIAVKLEEKNYASSTARR